MAKIFIRPGLKNFLRELKKSGFEIILFTAGNLHYMKSVVAHILAKDKRTGEPFFDHILCRDEMRILAEISTNTGELTKDLNCLTEGRFLKDMILVDNTEQKAYMQPKNLVPIVDFKGEGSDGVLKHLAAYLKEFDEEFDVRKKIVRDFHQ
jgi:TFIIF-interacting CTD phosphatase-like protein